jgi:hypothetical protein
VNAAYASYARSVGFHVDACLPASPEDKGKVESRIGRAKPRIDPRGKHFESINALQAWTDEQIEKSRRHRVCPATGRSVHESWLEERRHLQPLPILPQPFDVVVNRPVHKDCIVNFEGRSYSVPFLHAERTVEVRGCAGIVQILYDGRVIAEHERGTERRLVIDPAHYEGEGDERVHPPMPLGKMSRRLQEIFNQPVEQRPLDLYAALAEVAR